MNHQAVLSPWQWRSHSFKNRILLTGHSVLYGENGFFTPRHAAYYAERARGGVGLIISEQQAAHPSGRNYHQGLTAYSADAIPSYRLVTGPVRALGVPILAQLFCGGAQGIGTMYIDAWRPLLSPSGIRSTQFGETPAVMSAEDITDVTASFVRSALHAIEGGFSGIQIHVAHSQLLGSFLSPAFNKRDDEYGGSLGNRCRIVREIVGETRRAIGPEPLLGIRISADEHLGGGGITPDEALDAAGLLTADGHLDFVDVSAGGYFAKSVSVPPMASSLSSGFLTGFTSRLRERVGDEVALFSVGRVTTLAEAERVLVEGRLDMVGMTRAHMADPHHIAKAQAGREAEIRHCIGANVCARRLVENLQVTCVMNPAMGREAGRRTEPARVRTPLRVAVVGGGPAGLACAARAAADGHRITLFEEGDALGGRLRALARLPLRERWGRGIENLVAPLRAAGAEIVLNTRVDERTLAAIRPDVVVLATGAEWDLSGYTPYRPDRDSIPGLRHVRSMGLDEAVLTGAAQARRHLVIVDESGEAAAAAFSIAAAEAGARCTIVTPLAAYSEVFSKTYELPYFFGRMEQAGVGIHSSSTIDEVDPDGTLVLRSLISGRISRVEAVDLLVFASGKLPRVGLALPVRRAGYDVRLVGDVRAPRSIEAVIEEGDAVARALTHVSEGKAA